VAAERRVGDLRDVHSDVVRRTRRRRVDAELYVRHRVADLRLVERTVDLVRPDVDVHVVRDRRVLDRRAHRAVVAGVAELDLERAVRGLAGDVVAAATDDEGERECCELDAHGRPPQKHFLTSNVPLTVTVCGLPFSSVDMSLNMMLPITRSAIAVIVT